jgi:monoterpene epsilon-lactone hydrolase
MVMADRPGVVTASPLETVLTVAELGARISATLATLPLHQPWSGPQSIVDNAVEESLRELLKTLLTYSMNLPTPRLRSLEKVLDDLCKVVLPPIAGRDGVTVDDDTVGGIPGVWVRPPGRPRATILYLHGGGYLATTPWMYTIFASELVRATGCDLFIVDYRLAPEFPFPAGLDDAVRVFEALLEGNRTASQIVVAGDSGGGGLATSLFEDTRADHLPEPACALLFSPEVDLVMSEESITGNARHDVLPDEIPVRGYLGELDAHDPLVSVVYADVEGFPPSFVARGTNEMFRDEIGEFVARLHDTGIEVESFLAPHMFHVYEILMPWAGASRATLKAAADFLDAHLTDG